MLTIASEKCLKSLDITGKQDEFLTEIKGLRKKFFLKKIKKIGKNDKQMLKIRKKNDFLWR